MIKEEEKKRCIREKATWKKEGVMECM